MVTFVVLHYLSYEMTEKCVQKLLSTFQYENISIVIVDNGSKNGSGERLKEKFENNKHCSILINESNLGFACGNNVGYLYAKKRYAPDFIVVMNNDVLIITPEWINTLYGIYNEREFYVCGPDIINKKGEHQSPMHENGYTYDEVKRLVEFRAGKLKHFKRYYYDYWFRCTLSYYIKKRGHDFRDNQLSLSYKEGAVIHGACIVYSKKYIDVEDYAFYPKTFLYFEEDILHYICKKKKYKIIYTPDISVRHMEDVSTDLAFKSGLKKTKMQFERSVESGRVLLKLMCGAEI